MCVNGCAVGNGHLLCGGHCWLCCVRYSSIVCLVEGGIWAGEVIDNHYCITYFNLNL